MKKILKISTTAFRLVTMAGVLISTGAFAAQKSATPHAGHDMSTMHSQMHRDMKKMMDDMHAVKMSGSMDIDFAKMMIPHHQGAIDMAQMELNHGTDPTLKKMASKVIEDQQKEIKMLQDWLSKNEKSG